MSKPTKPKAAVGKARRARAAAPQEFPGGAPGALSGAMSEGLGAPSRRKKRAPEVREPLSLPDGALIRLRRSGGLRFSTVEIVVGGDGRVQWSRTGTGEGARAGAAKLSKARLAALGKAIEAARLDTVKRPRGGMPPDGNAYELASATASVEVFDGGVPAQVEPLIAQLMALASQV